MLSNFYNLDPDADLFTVSTNPILQAIQGTHLNILAHLQLERLVKEVNGELVSIHSISANRFHIFPGVYSPLLIVLIVPLVLQVGASSHESMESLVPVDNLALFLQVRRDLGLKLIGGLLVLILGCNAKVGNSQLRGITRVKHSGMALDGCHKRSSLDAGKGGNLSAPTVANDGPLLNGRELLLKRWKNLLDLLDVVGGVGSAAEEIMESLLLLRSVGGNGGDGKRLVLEDIGNYGDGVGGGSQNIGALECLGPIDTKDIVDNVDTGLGGLVASDVWNITN